VTILSSKIDLTSEKGTFTVEPYFAKEAFVLCQEAFQETFPNETVTNETNIII
jgi:hypothetical protein